MKPDKQDILVDRIRDVIAETLAIETTKISMDSDFRADLEADSIDLVSLVMMLEETFDVSISVEFASSFRNLNDVYSYFKNNEIGK